MLRVELTRLLPVDVGAVAAVRRLARQMPGAVVGARVKGLLTAGQVRDLPDRLADADARLLPYTQTAIELLGVPTGIVRAAILSDDYIATLADSSACEDVISEATGAVAEAVLTGGR